MGKNMREENCEGAEGLKLAQDRGKLNGFCGHGKEILALLKGVKFLYYLQVTL
jgi:hypothetical protein